MMPWYPDQFAAATSTWEFAERSLYRALLDVQWQLGTLPSDPRRLARSVGMERTEFDAAWPTVREKFEVVGAGLRNKRLEEHRVKALAFAEARREGARTTNAKRYGERPPSETHSARTPPRSAPAQRDAQRSHLSPSLSSEKKSVPLDRSNQGTDAPAAPIGRPRSGRQNGGPAEEPEVMRVAKALQLLKADPQTKPGDAARMYRVTVAQIEAAQAAIARMTQAHTP